MSEWGRHCVIPSYCLWLTALQRRPDHLFCYIVQFFLNALLSTWWCVHASLGSLISHANFTDEEFTMRKLNHVQRAIIALRTECYQDNERSLWPSKCGIYEMSLNLHTLLGRWREWESSEAQRRDSSIHLTFITSFRRFADKFWCCLQVHRILMKRPQCDVHKRQIRQIDDSEA